MNTGMEYEDILMRNQELMAIINRLTIERDEARREICNRTSYPDRTPETEAKMRGWDCFRIKGIVVSKGKAVPPKFELGEDDK